MVSVSRRAGLPQRGQVHCAKPSCVASVSPAARLMSSGKRTGKSFSGTGTKSLRKTKAVTKGYTYRLRSVVKVYSGTKVIEANAYYSKEHKY